MYDAPPVRTLPPGLHITATEAERHLQRAYLIVVVRDGHTRVLRGIGSAVEARRWLRVYQHPDPRKAFDLRIWSTRQGAYL